MSARRSHPARPLGALVLCAAALVGFSPAGRSQGVCPEGSTVSALGRTAFVRADGSFTISNVPATLGNFRVRLICLDGRMGESGCLAPVVGGSVSVGGFVFENLTPVPNSLEVTSPMGTFTQPGETSQLQVTGMYTGAPNRDLTRDPCTTYRSSSASVMVSPTGLATAVDIPAFFSTVIITVFHDGVAATASLNLAPNPDVDGDGMTNDYELRNGFDPNSPFDAELDADFDGLTNLQEFQRGSDPRDPDTDRDGIPDGDDPDPTTPESTPPTVRILTPADGATFIEGELIPVEVEATDDVQVRSVRLLANNEPATGIDPQAPYEFRVPLGEGTFDLVAEAQDVAGNTGRSAPVRVTVMADPGTTVIGRVLDEQMQPLAGATVTVLSLSDLTDATGAFSIPGVPTVVDTLVATATFTDQAGQVLVGNSAPATPVRGGTTDVGDIILGARSSRGTDFWMAVQYYHDQDATQLILMSETATTYAVTATGLMQNGSVGPGAPVVIDLPASLEIQSDQVIESKGIHVQSQAPVTALLHYAGFLTNDIYLGIPTSNLGQEYLVMAYPETLSGRGFDPSFGPSEFVIIGTEDGTVVTVFPTCPGEKLGGDTPPGVPINLMLNRGETFQFRSDLQSSGFDVTGTFIQSSRPVAVIAGNGCADVPVGVAACDILSEMMLPIRTLFGQEFYTTPLGTEGNYVVRVLAAEDETAVTVDDGVMPQMFTLNGGQHRELEIGAAARITTSKRASVAQFAAGSTRAGTGDPFQMTILPALAGRSSHQLFAPDPYASLALIVAPNAAVPSVRLGGMDVSSSFAPLPGGTHQFAIVPVSTGETAVTANAPIQVYAVGYYVDGSYGYPAGF